MMRTKGPRSWRARSVMPDPIVLSPTAHLPLAIPLPRLPCPAWTVMLPQQAVDRPSSFAMCGQRLSHQETCAQRSGAIDLLTTLCPYIWPLLYSPVVS